MLDLNQKQMEEEFWAAERVRTIQMAARRWRSVIQGFTCLSLLRFKRLSTLSVYSADNNSCNSVWMLELWDRRTQFHIQTLCDSKSRDLISSFLLHCILGACYPCYLCTITETWSLIKCPHGASSWPSLRRGTILIWIKSVSVEGKINPGEKIMNQNKVCVRNQKLSDVSVINKTFMYTCVLTLRRWTYGLIKLYWTAS